MEVVMVPYEAVKYLASIPGDEPVFVLRAKDKFTPSVIKLWASLVAAPISKTESASEASQAKARDAMRLVKQIRTWQEEHPERVKVPD
jgi:hypothetical protein